MPAKSKTYTAEELMNFPYISGTLEWMDEEDGSMDMIREWQEWSFAFKSDALDPIAFVGGKSDRITLSIPRFDLFRFKEIATEKWVPYQTYLKMILRDHINQQRLTRK